MPSLKAYLKQPVVLQMISFGTIGALSTVIDFFFISVFTHFGLIIFWAIFFAYLLGAANGYLLNNSFTYRHLGQRHNFLSFGQYASISFVGLGLTEGIIYLMIELLHTSVYVNKLFAVVIVFFWNFLANRYWTFKKS